VTQLPNRPASPGSMPWHAQPSAQEALTAEAAWRNAKTPEAKAEVHRAYCAAHGLPDPAPAAEAREPEAAL
jgi:hypothetical protein